ncbi:hypothetical protein PROFUN_01304 [Planoprotostelium fungivorum]|uniref:C2H2-type domain-containing protein n=1 Tax=Planoprotostelium fungivorum TaxID=1890364 RepID=A0A2P6NZQ8_9EUKA|nr:hypothetical protein PROFUN_01304 [Planoprotostelium fungivorum]
MSNQESNHTDYVPTEADIALLAPHHLAIYQQLNSFNMFKAAATFLQEAVSSTRALRREETFTDDETQQILSALTASSNQMSVIAAENRQIQMLASQTLPPPLPEDSEAIDKKRVIYNCKYHGCTGSFTTLANMKRHEKLHSGEKPYVCPVASCSKSFARKYDLKVHTRTHTKEKPYACGVCSKKFSRVSSMREHERNLHGLNNSCMDDEKKDPQLFVSIKEEVKEEPIDVTMLAGTAEFIELPVTSPPMTSPSSIFSDQLSDLGLVQGFTPPQNVGEQWEGLVFDELHMGNDDLHLVNFHN